MLKCSSCLSLKSFAKFEVDKSLSSGFKDVCKDCIKLAKSQEIKVAKKAAEQFMLDKFNAGEKFTCSSCKSIMTADKFYYKIDRGYTYVNFSACKQCTKDRQRFRSFGITPEQFQSLLEKQDHKCAICRIPHDEYTEKSSCGKVFSIDHCHSTGKIRGLLCGNCNRGLGYFKDSIEVLTKAISYLKGNDMV